MHPPAIAISGEFDRVIAVQEESTIALELERLQEGRKWHGPTIAYRIDKAVLGDGTLYYAGGYNVLRGGATGALLPAVTADEFSEAQLCTNYVIDRYFGHWLADGLVLEFLAEQRSMPALALAGATWLHEPGYRELCRLKVIRSSYARIDHLWVVDDRGMNFGLVERFRKLRGRIISAAKQARRRRRVVLARGTLGAKRNLVNSGQVYEVLEKLGFEVVQPESETPRELIEKLSGTELVISVEGSAQNHCWYALPPRSAFIAIQPPSRFTAIGKARADIMDIHWAYVVADPHPDGFLMPTDRLLRTIDEVDRVAATRS